MLLWADGFEHYCDDEALFLDGSYGQASHFILSTTHPATQTRSLFFNSDGGQSDFGLRKVLPTAIQKVGVAARFYVPTLPNGQTSINLFDFVPTDAGGSHIGVFCGSNGQLALRRAYEYNFNGGRGTLVTSSDPLLVANAWNHLEIQFCCHDTLGWLRAAVNGVHRYQVTGIDTRNADDGLVHSIRNGVAWGHGFDGGVANFYMDDYFIYDFNGNPAVDTDFCPTVDVNGVATNYMGDLQVMYLPPNGDTAEADWLPSAAGSVYPLIGEGFGVPVDDTTFAYSTADTDLSEYALTDLPPEITYIRGLMPFGRLSKSDAGVARTKFGMKSVAAVTDAAERPITVQPTYWNDFINVDPNSGARWTRTSLNAAWMRLLRTA